MKVVFLEVVARAKRKYPFTLENFSILNNHIHLIVKPRHGTSLSVILQWILGVFAMKWNRIHKTSGHVWGERFHSKILDSLLSYLRASHYVDENPVAAGLVDRAEQWRYGGLWYSRFGPPGLLDTSPGDLPALEF